MSRCDRHNSTVTHLTPQALQAVKRPVLSLSVCRCPLMTAGVCRWLRRAPNPLSNRYRLPDDRPAPGPHAALTIRVLVACQCPQNHSARSSWLARGPSPEPINRFARQSSIGSLRGTHPTGSHQGVHTRDTWEERRRPRCRTNQQPTDSQLDWLSETDKSGTPLLVRTFCTGSRAPASPAQPPAGGASRRPRRQPSARDYSWFEYIPVDDP